MKFKVWYNKVNERMRSTKTTWYHMRRHWTFVDKDERELWGFNLETVVAKKRILPFSFRFHIGNAGSETAWDGHLIIFGAGFYWSLDGLKKLAHRITSTPERPWGSRDLRFRIEDGRLYTELWVHNDLYSRKIKRGSWRRRSYLLNPIEAIWGPKRYSYEDIEEFDTEIVMPEGSYPVTIKLQMVMFGRTKSNKWKHERSWSLDVDAREGLPLYRDDSGGWKGSRVYGFGVPFAYSNVGGWRRDAVAAVTGWAFTERSKNSWVADQLA